MPHRHHARLLRMHLDLVDLLVLVVVLRRVMRVIARVMGKVRDVEPGLIITRVAAAADSALRIIGRRVREPGVEAVGTACLRRGPRRRGTAGNRRGGCGGDGGRPAREVGRPLVGDVAEDLLRRLRLAAARLARYHYHLVLVEVGDAAVGLVRQGKSGNRS